MLTPTSPWGAPVRPYRSPVIVTRFADEPWQADGYWELRRQVFVVEQGLFTGSDRDEEDDAALPIVALSTAAGMLDQVVGAVRIYALDGGTWFGGRLAVCRSYRRHGDVGGALIRTAVGSARGLGCRRFLATVQEENVRYFERHHFHPIEVLSLLGRAHRLMEADVLAFDVPEALRFRALEAA